LANISQVFVLPESSNYQTRNQLGTPVERRFFWGEPKFYIDSMYKNNSYAYCLGLHML